MRTRACPATPCSACLGQSRGLPRRWWFDAVCRLLTQLRRCSVRRFLGVPHYAGVLLLASSMASLAYAQAPSPGPSGSFSPAQRAEIVQIMRDALRTDPSILREAILALRADQQAREAHASQAALIANHAALFENPADPVIGNPHGKVTIVEFYDVRCPYCRRMRPAIKTLIARNPDLRIVMKDLPILGPASVLGARALLAAQRQGGYAAMQQALMTEGTTVDQATIEKAARAAGLNWSKLSTDMAAPAVQAQIDQNLQLAAKLGLHGTPAIVFGDQMAPGALSLSDLQQVVNALRTRSG